MWQEQLSFRNQETWIVQQMPLEQSNRKRRKRKYSKQNEEFWNSGKK